MSMRQSIETKIMAELSPEHLEVIDESHMHAVPPGAQSHFKLIIVSGEFAGEPLIRRHQRVNAILAEELNGSLHALSLQTLTLWWRRMSAAPPNRGTISPSRTSRSWSARDRAPRAARDGAAKTPGGRSDKEGEKRCRRRQIKGCDAVARES